MKEILEYFCFKIGESNIDVYKKYFTITATESIYNEILEILNTEDKDLHELTKNVDNNTIFIQYFISGLGWIKIKKSTNKEFNISYTSEVK